MHTVIKMKTKKPKKQLLYDVAIPEGIDVTIGDTVNVKGPNGEINRKLRMPNVNLEKVENKLVLSSKKSTKREKKIMCTIKAHLKNMVLGVQEPFIYKLQICSVHFPMTVNIDMPNNLLTIKNFFGESTERKAKLIEGVIVKMEGDIITVESCDIEKAGQTAANIETSTKVRGKDRRIFQDGIFIINKAGEDIAE